MADIFDALYKGEYFETEKKNYPQPEALQPESQTGFLQKRLEEIEEKFQKKSIAYDSEISFLRMQLEALTLRIRELKDEFDVHRNQDKLSQEVIEARDIPIEKIKEEIVVLMSDGKTRYFDEIAAELKLDIADVVEAFKQLQEEGKLFVDGNKI